MFVSLLTALTQSYKGDDQTSWIGLAIFSMWIRAPAIEKIEEADVFIPEFDAPGICKKIRFASIVLYVLLQFKLILRTLWWSDDPFEITLWVTFSVISAFLFNHITECRQENTIKTSFDKNIKKFLGVPLIHAHA